jgi:hypothetical protein
MQCHSVCTPVVYGILPLFSPACWQVCLHMQGHCSCAHKTDACYGGCLFISKQSRADNASMGRILTDCAQVKLDDSL